MGEANYRALAEPTRWLLRKRERILLLDAAVFDRELEIEFVVPPVFREDRNANRRYAAIVVAWVPNGYASMVEVVDAAGVRAPTLSAAEANKLQVEIILALAQDLLKASPPPSLRVAIEETIRTGSVTPFARSEAWRDMFAGQLRDTRRGPETAERLVKALLEATRSEPVVLELDAEREDRRLVRLSYRMHVSKTLPKSVHIGQWSVSVGPWDGPRPDICSP